MTQHEKDLNKATNLAIASIFGAIIPIAGVVLAIMAAIVADGVPDKYETKKRSIKTLLIFGLVFSIIAGYFYYQGYRENVKQQQIVNQATLDTISATAFASKVTENKLIECKDAANKSYFKYAELNGATKKEDGTYWGPQKMWDIASKNKKDALDECYRAYNAAK
jgi:hypothetical protein